MTSSKRCEELCLTGGVLLIVFLPIAGVSARVWIWYTAATFTFAVGCAILAEIMAWHEHYKSDLELAKMLVRQKYVEDQLRREEAQAQREEAQFQKDFKHCFFRAAPQNDWERRNMQGIVDIIIAQKYSSEAFKEARHLADRAGLYICEDRGGYLKLLPDPKPEKILIPESKLVKSE